MGWIMLVQFASLGEGENDGRFTVKKYHGGNQSPLTAGGTL